jgi:putative FmdB family regulatory protein
MPIYEYECQACGHTFEEWQKITAPPVKKCPSCKKRRVERLVSATSFTLKGSGWYVTDYGNRSTNSASKSESKEHNSASKSESREKSGQRSNGKSEDSSSKKKGGKSSSSTTAAAA